METFNGNIQINYYDAEGLRHEMEENGKLVTFIYRGDEVIAEESQEDRIRYIRTSVLLASDAESARTYYHYASDEMGSITHVVDENEEILNHYEYDAWGNLTVCEEKVQNRFKFNSQQYDPISQQYYLRARYYNPVIGRFTQEDSYNVDGLNLYVYCRNNPVSYVDPSGTSFEKEKNRILNNVINTSVIDEKRKLVEYIENRERNGSSYAIENQNLVVINYSNGQYNDDYDDQYDDLYDERYRNKNKRNIGKEYRGGDKKNRDKTYGINEPEFWKWWEKKKAKEGGKDIENMNDAKEAYAQWVSEGKPDVTNMNKRKRRKGR